MSGGEGKEIIAAELMLRALKRNGVEHVFGNAGTDFAVTRSTDDVVFTHLRPSPAFQQIVEASGGHGEVVASPDELKPAITRALDAVQREGRQALVNVLLA